MMTMMPGGKLTVEELAAMMQARDDASSFETNKEFACAQLPEMEEEEVWALLTQVVVLSYGDTALAFIRGVQLGRELQRREDSR